MPVQRLGLHPIPGGWQRPSFPDLSASDSQLQPSFFSRRAQETPSKIITQMTNPILTHSLLSLRRFVSPFKPALVCRPVSALLLLLALSSSCAKKDDDGSGGTGPEKTGTFKIDGVSYKGKTSIITIGGIYSVSCQQDEPYKLLQVHFGSKEEAEKGGTFNVRDFGLSSIDGEVEVGVDGLTFDPDGSYSVTVKNKKITMTNVKLIQTGQGKKKPVINEATIEF